MGLLSSFRDFFTYNNRRGSWSLLNNGNSAYQHQRISEEKAIQGFTGNDAVYSIIHKICLNGSTVPFEVLKNDKEVGESDKYLKLLEEPLPDVTRQEWMYRAINYLTLTGDLYILKDESSIGFGVDALQILPSQCVISERETANDILSPVSKYIFEHNGKRRTYEPSDIIHLKYFDPSIDGQEQNQGLSPLQSGQYILEANNNLTIAESSILENRGANNIISSGDTQYSMTPSDKEALDEGFKQRAGGARNMNKTLVVGAKIQVHPLGMTPSDMKLVESYPNQLRRLCTLFSMPAEIFNAEGSGQFNTRKEALKSSYTEAILPVVELINKAVDRGTRDIVGEGYSTKILRSEIEALNPSKEEQIANWIEMFDKGLISRELFLELTGMEDSGTSFNSRQNITINGQG